MGGTDLSRPPAGVPMKRRRLWLGLAAVVLLGLSGLWLTRLRWLPEIGIWLNVSDPLAHAPVVLILPGSEETRPFVAASLMKAGFADRALVPETRANPDVHDGVELPTAETTRQILIRRGIPATKIVTLQGASNSTMSDAMALDRYFQQSGVTDVIIVTSAYHSRRARWTFRQAMPQHQARFRFYGAPNGFDERVWWTSRKGRQAVLSEWLKFLFYIMYHGRGWLCCLVSITAGGAFVLFRCRGVQSRVEGRDHVGVRTPDQSGGGA